MGSHSKPSRYRLINLLPAAAVPALAGLAATAFLAPQAMADPLPAHTATQSAAAAQPAEVTDVADYASASTGHLLAVAQRATERQAASAPVAKYTVRSGDTLSTIAGHVYHNPAAWPVLYWANHSQIRWANAITAGQVLKVPAKPAKIPHAPGQLGPAALALAPAGVTSAGQAYAPASAAPAASYSGGSAGGSFGQCVIARESGGNTQVMNASGHYGLYQFSESTWVAYGGSAASFGNASVAEQNQVFANALAQGGQSNWSAYDGC